MATKIWAYNPGSQSAQALAGALGVRILKHEGSRYRPRREDTIINWGASQIPQHILAYDLFTWNAPSAVRDVSNKLTFFQSYGDSINVPKFTTRKDEACDWLNDGIRVIGRQTLTGHSGAGIIFIEDPLDIPDCPLYVEYVPKKSEYRVHFFAGQIIDVQRKIRDPEREPTEWRVRSHQNGFIFARNDVRLPEVVCDQVDNFLEVTDLDFGALDIIYNEHRNDAFILECNSAPGLTGTTLEKYVEAFKNVGL